MILKSSTDSKNRRLVVEALRPGYIIEQGKQMVAQGVQAILARGGTFHVLSTVITEIPVVQLYISAEDILSALSTVKHYHRVYLIISEAIVFDFEKYKDLFNISIICYKFKN
jgi:hypothetical protein